jgi:hypothetical protein
MDRLSPTPAVQVCTAAVTYTCPMHPEVVRSQPGACPKCGMALETRKKEAMPDQHESRHRTGLAS